MDPKQLLLEHFEKGVLAGFAVWLLGTLFLFTSQPKQLEKRAELQQQMNVIKQHMNTAPLDDLVTPGYVADLERDLQPEAEGASFPLWSMHQRPVFLYGVAAVGATHTARHEAPVDLALDAGDRGKVVLSWKSSVENEYVVIDSYVIERKVGEAGEWQELGTVDGVEESYADSAVQPRTDYYYRVTSIAQIDRDNPVVDNENMTLEEAEQRKTGSEAGPIKTARDVYMIPTQGDPVTREEQIAGQNENEEWAYIRVYRWSSEEGRFENKPFRVKRGGAIGEKIKKGKRTIDFTTGATLDDVDYKKVKWKHGEREVLWVQIKYADGTVEELTDKDELPEEVKGGK